MTRSILPSQWDLVKELGRSLAQSGLLNLQNDRQGEVVAFSCINHGRDPLSIPEQYHVLGNKLSLRSDAMLGRLVADGGTYTVVEHSSDAAEIEANYQARTYRERLTWQDAQQEPFVYAGKQAEVATALAAGKASSLKLSANYSTPRRRSQHLWARVVSDAVRVIAPNLIAGCYTPVEVSDWTGAAITSIAEEKDASTLADPHDEKCSWCRQPWGTYAPDDPRSESAKEHAEAKAVWEAKGKPEPVFEESLDEVIGAGEVASLRQLIADVSQSVPGLAQSIKDRLALSGCKLADLSKRSSHDLRAAIEAKEIAAIAEAMITQGKPPA